VFYLGPLIVPMDDIVTMCIMIHSAAFHDIDFDSKASGKPIDTPAACGFRDLSDGTLEFADRFLS